ncbi:MAG TPA: helix-turn-helix domain-containing protein [Acidimicrobiales bacterium]|jgi:transcriptional regulator with XRE-family HTH domain|nr:helix-turn-helix domain-containing protein [Acidimicrobiales bacterium]
MDERVSSGIPDVDALLGGLILGDNVVWVLEKAAVARQLEDAMLAEATSRGEGCFYVSANPDQVQLRARLGTGVTVLDARPRGAYGDAAGLETAIIEGARSHPPGYVVVDGLSQFARRWGSARAVAFFSRVCPRLFDLGAVAYWRAPRSELGPSFIDQITSVTQCVIEISDGHLRVVKAEGRPASVQARLLRLEASDGTIRLEDERALGRLGRGLERVRRERNLNQTDLARLAGVTQSAISQAEAGRRGLSLDTLLVLSERLNMGIDDLLASAPVGGYVLARRPRTLVEAQTALLDDPQPGLRVHLVRLGPGEAGSPNFLHKGAELVLVASGLVQLTIGSDTPVMRAGDAALATSVAVSGWRNLINTPALLFWVLRDDPGGRPRRGRGEPA